MISFSLRGMSKRKSEYSPFKLLCEKLRLEHIPPVTLTEMAEKLPYKGKRGRIRQKSNGQSQLSSFENGNNHSLEQVYLYAQFFYLDDKDLFDKEKNEGIFNVFETALLSSDSIDISSLPPSLKGILAKLTAAFLLCRDIGEPDKHALDCSSKFPPEQRTMLKTLTECVKKYEEFVKSFKLSYKTEIK
jgi:transcriptional regulator with XRE-family HTH domain